VACNQPPRLTQPGHPLWVVGAISIFSMLPDNSEIIAADIFDDSDKHQVNASSK